MRKFVVSICLLLFVSACADIGRFSNPINTNRLAAIEASYGIALSAAVAYRNMRLCRKNETATITNPCAYRYVIVQLQTTNAKIQGALIKARQFVRENQTLGFFTAVSAAQEGLTELEAIIDTYGVR